MATATHPPVGATGPEAPTVAPHDGIRRAYPVKWWAAFGIACFALQVAVWAVWASSDRFETTTFGRDEVPDLMRWFLMVLQVSTTAAFPVFAYRWIVRPIRREGRFSIEGMLCVCFLLMWWQDPFVNYTQNWVTYNTALWNYGSWTTDIPGWVAPLTNRFGEPFMWIAPTLAIVFAGLAMFGAWFMRSVKARYPSMGKLGLLASLFGVMFVLDLLLEIAWMRTGSYTYGGSIGWMTLFHGHYYQFPLYEAVLVALVMTAFSAVVYFRNDRGETMAERRASELAVSTRTRTVLRFFAVLGISHALFFAYDLSVQWFSLRADEWPADVLERPYFLDGICGPGTDYACSGPGVPIPREGSVHLGPDGALVVPDGVSIRDESLIDQ